MNKANAGNFAKERIRLPREQWKRQNYPIQSSVKSKRIYMAEPINETCWAYMKLLREHSDMKKVYDVNPYAEVYQFRENVYAIFTESADGMGDAWMYLLIGPERAMLIDTGFGIGDLKGLCDAITGRKELLVVNTHGHYDHAYGNCRFERVYCHEYEVASLQGQDGHIWDYLFQDDGVPIWSEFDKEDLPAFKPYEICGVPDGYTWNLGEDYEVELIHLGGHTAGHAGFLDKKGRNFFCGDDFISMRVGIFGPRPYLPYGEYATVAAFYRNVEKLCGRLPEFDHLFPGHFVTDIESSVVPNMCKALQYVLAAPAENCDSWQDGPKGRTYQKYVEGLGTLAYRENSAGQ